jgi:hypothetical protein
MIYIGYIFKTFFLLRSNAIAFFDNYQLVGDRLFNAVRSVGWVDERKPKISLIK